MKSELLKKEKELLETKAQLKAIDEERQNIIAYYVGNATGARFDIGFLFLRLAEIPDVEIKEHSKKYAELTEKAQSLADKVNKLYNEVYGAPVGGVTTTDELVDVIYKVMELNDARRKKSEV